MDASPWREIWERKGERALAEGGRPGHETLIRADGFDGGAGRIAPEGFRRIAGIVRARLRLAPGRRLLEVGCGAGALLLPLSEAGVAPFGVDPASGLLALARRALGARVARAEAAALPFADRSFDATVSHSVFHYFPDLAYARRALSEMRRVSRGPALVLDVPDLATREASERARAAAGSKPGPLHLYYPQGFFLGLDSRAQLFREAPAGYGNAAFRYHVLLP